MSFLSFSTNSIYNATERFVEAIEAPNKKSSIIITIKFWVYNNIREETLKPIVPKIINIDLFWILSEKNPNNKRQC